MEGSLAVDTLVGMGTKVIPLGLDNICSQLSPTEAVNILNGIGQSRYRDTPGNGNGCNPPKARQSLLDLLLEELIQHQIGQLWISLISLSYLIQKFCLDNAASPKDSSDAAKVQIPLIYLGSGTVKGKSLGIGGNLAGIKAAANILNETLWTASAISGAAKAAPRA